MEKIVESYAQAQEHWALNGITIHLAGYTMRNVNLYVPLAYIIADVEEAQAITSFFTSRGVNGISPRICRTCDVSLDNACRTTEECHRYEQKEIRELYNNEEKEKLHDIQQRYVFNTFYLIDMGDDKHGIYGKCHTELLHALEEGIIKYLLEILVETVLKPSHLVTFDEYIRCMCCQLGDHGKDNFPRTSWKNGFTKLSYLDAGDRVGKLFTATLFLLSQTGAEIFDKIQLHHKHAIRRVEMKGEDPTRFRSRWKISNDHGSGVTLSDVDRAKTWIEHHWDNDRVNPRIQSQLLRSCF